MSIPGGWFGLPLAGAIAAAGAAVWVQRRRRWHPGPLDLDDLDDLDLIPLPGSIAAARAALREQAPDLIDPPRRYPTVAEYAADDYAQPLPPPGPDGLQLSGLTAPPQPEPAPEPVPDDEQFPPDPLTITTSDANGPASGITLSGPGADAAARALLVASLSAGNPEDPEAAGAVITTAATLTTLLGTGTVDVSPIPRLTVCGSLPEALALAEAQVIDRRRILDDHALDPTSARRAAASADVGAATAGAPYPPLLPPVLLLTTTPEPRHHDRLTTLLALGKPLRIDAVILGDWPTGRPEHLDHAGRRLPPSLPPTAHDPDPDLGEPTVPGVSRIATLDVAGATELLQVIAEAHTGTPPRPAHTAPSVEPSAASHGTAPTRARPEPARQPAQKMAGDAEALAGKVRVRLLGDATILNEAGEPVPGLRLHARELLVYLAVHRAGADLPDIMEAIWPTATVRRAQERLSTEVANLRRTLRAPATDTTLQPVINTGGRYHLNPELLDLDLWHLDDALHQAASTPNLEHRRGPLQAAVDAGIGFLADGHDYDWLEPHREHTRRQLIRARIHLADLIAGSEPGLAAYLLDEAADLDATNEALARRHLEALEVLSDGPGQRRRLRRLTRELEAIDAEPVPELAERFSGDVRPDAIGDPTRTDSPGCTLRTGRSPLVGTPVDVEGSDVDELVNGVQDT